MFSRRDLLRALGAAAVAHRLPSGLWAEELPYRPLGRTGRAVVPLALGGQATLQYPTNYFDPPDIIVRAVELGLNYLDTANAYGPSQAQYGMAFDHIHLKPNDPDYNAALRERLYIASKTGNRYSRIRSQPNAATAISDLKTTMTQMFGDGRGYVPEGAYLDCFQLHNLGSITQVDQIYAGLERRDDPQVDPLGALAGLLDFRDGANLTGLNPEKKRWIKRIGITGHPADVLMNCMQRDQSNILETLLLPINVNDRRYFSNHLNAVPVARARGMAVIAIKLFGQGAMYNRPTNPTVIQTVGVPGGVAPADLIRYTLSLPGVDAAAVGIGHINRNDLSDDQLVANIQGAVAPSASPAELLAIESQVAQIHGTSTNGGFQPAYKGLQQPTGVQATRDADRVIIRWNTALAGDQPIHAYQVYAGANLVATVPFTPQTTLDPLSLTVPASAIPGDPIRVVATVNSPFPPRRR